MKTTEIIRLFLVILLLVGSTEGSVYAQTIVGRWKCIDDKTGKEKSVVEIVEQGGRYVGRIIQLINPEKPDPLCDLCTDHRKNQKILGMIIITGLKKDGNEYSGGEILDPEIGKTYRCKLWVENGKLMVRGYVAFLFRTQVWQPVR